MIFLTSPTRFYRQNSAGGSFTASMPTSTARVILSRDIFAGSSDPWLTWGKKRSASPHPHPTGSPSCNWRCCAPLPFTCTGKSANVTRWSPWFSERTLPGKENLLTGPQIDYKIGGSQEKQCYSLPGPGWEILKSLIDKTWS
jgi:hypothetical protein